MSQKKIKLMQITHDLRIGGLQQVVVNICRTIDRDTFDMSVLCLRDLGEFATEIEKKGIRVIQLPQKKRGTDYLSFMKVATILHKEQIDVIHTHNTQPFVDGTIAALMSGVKTIVHTDHGRTFPDKRRYMFAEWLVSHYAYKVVGVSEPLAQDLISYEKISPEKVVVIPNGIDGARYKREIDIRTKRKDIGITKNGPVIGIGVRLVKEKGITFLLRAMPEIIKEMPEITLVIAGEGNYEETLRREAFELGVQNHTLFVGPRMDMPEVLKAFDLYVLPSLGEGLPLVLLEAMAAHCPIVATDVGGNYMAVRHGESGSLVEPGNPSALSAEIIKLLKDNGLRTRYAERGFEIFEKNFSAEMMTQKYQELYLKEE